MALQNNPYLFTGGSERIDTRPHIQLYAQLKAKEQARNDAFDEYMRNINMKINPAGMRYQDMPAFESGLKKMQDFGMQNREFIQNPRKDRGAASMEFQKLYQQQLNRAAASKMAAEGLKPFIEVNTDPKKAALLNKDKAMKAVQAHDQPQEIQDATGEFVPNPNFRPFNPSDLEFHPEEFDVPKYLKNLDYIKPTDKTEEIISTDPNTLRNKIRITSKFAPQDYDKMATIGVQTYYSDPSMKMMVDKMYNDPNNKEVVKLNDVFKSKFGKDISNEGDLAAAMTIAAKETTEQETKIGEDKFAQQQKMEEIKNANRRGLLRLHSELKEDDEEANDLWYDSYIDQVTADAKKNPSKVYPGAGLGWEIPLDPFLSKNLSVNGVAPDKLVITTDGKYVPIFYKRNDKGEIDRVKQNNDSSDIPMENKSLTFPLERDQLKVSLGGKSGVKQLNKEMSSGKGGNKPSTHHKTKTVEIVRGALD